MSEPEELLIEAAWHATIVARRLVRRGTRQPHGLELSAVRNRLELFVIALFGACPKLLPAEAPAPRSWLGRLATREPSHLTSAGAAASTDGSCIRLPQRIEPTRGEPDDLALLQLLAVAMASRAARGSPQQLPEPGCLRDLYLIAEAAAVDAALLRDLPGTARAMTREHERALAGRPVLDRLSPRERAVERCARSVLAHGNTDALGAADLPLGAAHELEALLRLERASPSDSLAWAVRMDRALSDVVGPYRGLAPVLAWGRVDPVPSAALSATSAASTSRVPSDKRPPRARTARLRRRPRERTPQDGEDDARPGSLVIKDATQQSVEDPLGLQRPTDREQAPDPNELADSLSELPEARLVRTPDPAREVLLSSEESPRATSSADTRRRPDGIVYPEWDCRTGSYRMPGAIVRELEPVLGDPHWAESVLRRRSVLLREVRQRFERLRRRQARLDRQLDGPELDLEAYVTTFADRKAGGPLEDRLYVTQRPLRRDLAVCLLLDVSASTDAWVSGQQRVIDVEKEALLIVCEALQLLGDDYAILAFSGEGPEHVHVTSVKGFAESYNLSVQRRIAGLDADRYTRVGAALRHASALLASRPARDRLLLLLTDGKPNDVDLYEGRYGVEDTRKAVIEARLAGLHPFCLAVDRHAPLYAPRLFGANAYAVLPHPARLPIVLLDLLRRLVVR